jgi:hypothetical protein
VAKKKEPSGPRWYQFRRWVAGRDPGYHPTMTDLVALAAGMGDPPPKLVPVLLPSDLTLLVTH